MNRKRSVVLAGGGTGGHVYPVMEIVPELHAADPDLQYVYIGQRGGPEYEIVRTAALPVTVRFCGITAEKLRRYWHWKLFILPFAVLAGTWQALTILSDVRPSVVLCKGGYVGVPVAIAAWLLRIPIVLHETDAVMGLANRLIVPFARRIAVSFPRYSVGGGDHKRGKLVYTGQPLSAKFFIESQATKESDRPRLVITGGSRGSEPINSLVAQILPQLVGRYTVVHLTGKEDFGRMRKNCQHRSYQPIDYTSDMVSVLQSADLVVSRAGGTIFELAALGKPSILIPLPSAANNHQYANAQILTGNDAAMMLDERSLTSAQLLEAITSLMQDSERRARYAKNIRQFARKDAAAQVARLVLEVATK